MRLFQLFLCIAIFGATAMAADLVIGDEAPPISLPNQEGKTVDLEAFRGHWVLVYFYPKDDTPGCTRQACSLRDANSAFVEEGLIVLGVSTDSTESHQKFREKHDLPFDLLADPDKKAVKAYGTEGTFFTQRKSFLIDPQGKIAWVFADVDVNAHAQNVLKKYHQLAEKARG